MYLLSWVVKLTFILRMLPSPGNNSSHPLHIPALKMQPLSMAACRLLREKASQHFSTSSPWLAPSKRAPYLACAIKVNALARRPQSVLTSHARAWSQRVGRVGCHILTTSSVFDPIIAISKLAISLFLQFPIKVKCWSFWVASFWWRLAQCSPSRWRWRRCDQRLPRRTPQEDCFHCLTRSSVPKVSHSIKHFITVSCDHIIKLWSNHQIIKTAYHTINDIKTPSNTVTKWLEVIRSKHRSKQRSGGGGKIVNATATISDDYTRIVISSFLWHSWISIRGLRPLLQELFQIKIQRRAAKEMLSNQKL